MLTLSHPPVFTLYGIVLWRDAEEVNNWEESGSGTGEQRFGLRPHSHRDARWSLVIKLVSEEGGYGSEGAGLCCGKQRWGWTWDCLSRIG